MSRPHDLPKTATPITGTPARDAVVDVSPINASTTANTSVNETPDTRRSLTPLTTPPSDTRHDSDSNGGRDSRDTNPSFGAHSVPSRSVVGADTGAAESDPLRHTVSRATDAEKQVSSHARDNRAHAHTGAREDTCQICGHEPGIADDLRPCEAHLGRGGECGQFVCKDCRTEYDEAGIVSCHQCDDDKHPLGRTNGTKRRAA